MHARERLYLTADKDRVVREGDPKAAFLYAALGDEIPNSAAERFGLVDGLLKPKKAGNPADPPPPVDPRPEPARAEAPVKKAAKAGGKQQPAGDKEQKPAGDKEEKPDETKGG